MATVNMDRLLQACVSQGASDLQRDTSPEYRPHSRFRRGQQRDVIRCFRVRAWVYLTRYAETKRRVLDKRHREHHDADLGRPGGSAQEGDCPQRSEARQYHDFPDRRLEPGKDTGLRHQRLLREATRQSLLHDVDQGVPGDPDICGS